MVQHCTPEQLALAALREPLPEADAAHLAGCAACRADVASLQRARDALAVPQLAAPGASVGPPPAVWESIAAATGITAAPPSWAGAPGEERDATVLPFRSRRRPLLFMAAAAVAAGAVVGAGAVALVQRTDEGGDPMTTVALAPLPDAKASGEAELVLKKDGSRWLQVDLDAPALQGSYYEVWLIDRSMKGMFPLGVVAPGEQAVELPPGLDVADFPLVDVSVEPLDGNPLHSGNSVARGEMGS